MWKVEVVDANDKVIRTEEFGRGRAASVEAKRACRAIEATLPQSMFARVTKEG